MNVKLVYKNSGYSIDLSKTTQTSYLYNVANKIYEIPLEKIQLYYESKLIPNNSKLLTDYIINNSKTIKITVLNQEENEIDSISNLIEQKKSPKNTLFKLKKKETNSNIVSKIKKNYLKCQICNKKDAILYCRKCNEFNCFECNIKYPEHQDHLSINLENGNLLDSTSTYKKELLKELEIVEKAYNKSSEWMITDEIRKEYLDNLIGLIKEIENKSQELSNLKTQYDVENNNILRNLKKEIFNIESPIYENEIIDIFSEINEKDKELDNYTYCVNLQVIKSKFNQKLIDSFEIIQSYLVSILNDAKSKIDEFQYLGKCNLNELEIYNENNFNIINEKIEDIKYKKQRKLFLPNINNYFNTEPKEILTENNNINEKKNDKKSYLSKLIERETMNTEKKIFINFSNDTLLKNIKLNPFSSYQQLNNQILEKSASESKVYKKQNTKNFYENAEKLKEILEPNNKKDNIFKKFSKKNLRKSVFVDVNKIKTIFSSPVKKKKKK
jgi:hypothetical protein